MKPSHVSNDTDKLVGVLGDHLLLMAIAIHEPNLDRNEAIFNNLAKSALFRFQI